jgi:hypothetical protein
MQVRFAWHLADPGPDEERIRPSRSRLNLDLGPKGTVAEGDAGVPKWSAYVLKTELDVNFEDS